MSSPGFALSVVAQNSRLDEVARRLGEGLREDRVRWDVDTIILWCICGLSILLSFWLISRLIQRQEWSVPYNSPRRLFLTLCRAHRLRWTDCWLLWRLARLSGLHDAGLLFIDPRYFAPENLPAGMQMHRERLNLLRKRLFEGLFATPNPNADASRTNAGNSQGSTKSASSGGGRRPRPTAGPPDAPRPSTPPTLDLPPWGGRPPIDTPGAPQA